MHFLVDGGFGGFGGGGDGGWMDGWMNVKGVG